MPQKKGNTGNPNGRPKGKPNKLTTVTREWVNKLLTENQQQFQEDLKQLTPKERVTIYEKLLQYAIPKAIKVEGDSSKPLSIEQQLRELSEEADK